jgi:hypothetical protein
VKVDNHEKQAFFVQIKENPHLLLAESRGSGSGCFCRLTQRQLIAVPFHTTFEPVFSLLLLCRLKIDWGFYSGQETGKLVF